MGVAWNEGCSLASKPFRKPFWRRTLLKKLNDKKQNMGMALKTMYTFAASCDNSTVLQKCKTLIQKFGETSRNLGRLQNVSIMTSVQH
jgi:hypothetical protein